MIQRLRCRKLKNNPSQSVKIQNCDKKYIHILCNVDYKYIKSNNINETRLHKSKKVLYKQQK